MCSATVVLPPPGLVRPPLAPAACHDLCSQVHERVETEFHPVRMNWVVFTDANGNSRLQMHWDAKT